MINFDPKISGTRVTGDEIKVKSLINKSATRLFDYDLPAFLCCVFMTKSTYENVFKSLKGKAQ